VKNGIVEYLENHGVIDNSTLQGWIKTLFYGYRVRCTLKFLNGKNAVAEKKEAVL